MDKKPKECEIKLTGDFEPSLPMLIHRLDRQLVAFFDYSCKKVGIGNGMQHVLFELKRGGEMTQNALAQKCHVTAPTMSITILKMENDGLVSRRKDCSDARKFYISITPKGVEVSKKIFKLIQAAETDAVKGISDQELAVVKSVIKKIHDNIEEETK